MSHSPSSPVMRQGDECDCGCQEERVGANVPDKTCDGSGTVEWCRTKEPHGHCRCGLPMAKGARYCTLCLLEQTSAGHISDARFRRDIADGLMAARSFHDPERGGYKGTGKKIRPLREAVL